MADPKFPGEGPIASGGPGPDQLSCGATRTPPLRCVSGASDLQASRQFKQRHNEIAPVNRSCLARFTTRLLESWVSDVAASRNCRR